MIATRGYWSTPFPDVVHGPEVSVTERARASRRTLVSASWLVFGLVYGLLTRYGPGATAAWRGAFLPTMGAALFWLAATPFVAATARRVRALPLPAFVRALLHVIPCAAMVLATAL